MIFSVRPLTAADREPVIELVTASFEPITWYRKVDERYGPLNGVDWRGRWRRRLEDGFDRQITLVGELDGELVAYAGGTLDEESALAFLDVLAVAPSSQGRGCGRRMLQAWQEHMKELGGRYVNLDCLLDNEAANELYRSEGYVEIARSAYWFKPLE